MRRARFAAAVLGLAVLACGPGPGRRGIECVAPANAGGGWDLTCRTAGRVLDQLDLIPGSVRVTNLPGAGGAIGFAHTVAKRRGDASLIVAASPATTLRIAQGQFGDFTEDDVRWLAAVAADYGLLAVHPASPWTSLPALLDAWRADPAALVVGGGSAVGGQDHMKVLAVARAAGIDPLRIRYVPFDGGGEAITALLGRFIHVFSGDATEARAQVESGSIRAVAVLAPDRLAGTLRDVATAMEQGVDVDWLTWRGFYVPPGVPDSVYDHWVGRLRAMEASPEWARLRDERGLARMFEAGPGFERLVREQVAEYRALSRALGLLR